MALAVLVTLAFVDWQPRPTPDDGGAGVGGVAGSGYWSRSWRQPLALSGVGAGFARVAMDPPTDCPLGGYAARHGAGPDSLLDPVGIGAMVLAALEESGSDSVARVTAEGESPGERLQVAMAAVDLVLIPESLRAAVAERLGGRFASLWVVATHDHAGPGGYWDNALAEFAGIGTYNAGWAAELADSIALAVERAAAALEPVSIDWGVSEAAAALVVPRSNKASPRRVPLYALRVRDRDRGEVRGGMVIHAAHPTILSHRSRLLSGEWPGECRRYLEDHCGGEWLVMQGPSGDLKPLLPDSLTLGLIADDWGVSEMRAYGAVVGELVERLSWRPLEMGEWAGSETLRPAPRADATGIVSAPWRRPVANALSFFTRDPQWVALLRLGELVLIGIPGEPVRAVAADLVEQVRLRIPGAKPLVIGLAGGYAGYVESAEKVRGGRGESAEVYFGPEFADLLSATVAEAADSLVARHSASGIR
jgi:hypothetical protein